MLISGFKPNNLLSYKIELCVGEIILEVQGNDNNLYCSVIRFVTYN